MSGVWPELAGSLLKGSGGDYCNIFELVGATSLAFRSSKSRCWADSCVIMLLPTRVGEKKSQVNARGEAARRHPSPEATPDLWDRWKTDCRRGVDGEACLRGRCGDFTSLGLALLARYSHGLLSTFGGILKKEPCCPTVETETLLRNLTNRVPRRKCNYCIFRDVWIERSDALIDSKDTKQGQGNAADSRLTFLLLFKPQWEALVIENLLCVVHYIVSDFSAECFSALSSFIASSTWTLFQVVG